MHIIIPQPLKIIKSSSHYQSIIFNDIKLLNDCCQMTIKHNTHDMIWSKNVTYGQIFICDLMCNITKNYEIIANITNHFGCVTNIAKMVVVNVPFEIMNLLRGHHNLKTLDHYNHTKLLKTCVIQKVLQSLDDENCNKL